MIIVLKGYWTGELKILKINTFCLTICLDVYFKYQQCFSEICTFIYKDVILFFSDDKVCLRAV